jgi:putative membrane protein
MISNFSDHSANERTFLAWVRTALGISAFGLAIPRLELLPGEVGLVGGFALAAVGSGVLVMATIRFVTASREIEQAESYRAGGVRGEVALSGLLLLVIAVFFALLWLSLRPMT